MAPTDEASSERSDLIETLDAHRSLLLRTIQGLTDEQAAKRTTVSELCLGGIVKHVAAVERNWVDFIRQGPPDRNPMDADSRERFAATFRMEATDTLQGLVETYQEVAERTNRVVSELPSLDVTQPLPPAPWFQPGARRSARRVFMHIVAETAQHAGHADIIREALDGSKTMG